MGRITQDSFAKFSKALGNHADWMSGLSENEFIRSDTYKYLINQLTKKLMSAKADVYDKAADAAYNATSVGGNNHRLFDGGHDITGAWERIKDALPDDTKAEEIYALFTVLWKDGITIKGIPFKTVEKSTFDELVDKITKAFPHIKKEYFHDLLTINAGEVFSLGVAAASALFLLSKDDEEKLSEVLGAMGANSIISANPLMGLLMIIAMGYAVFVRKMKVHKRKAARGAFNLGVSSAVFWSLSFKFWVELALALVISLILRKYILDNETLHKKIKRMYNRARMDYRRYWCDPKASPA